MKVRRLTGLIVTLAVAGVAQAEMTRGNVVKVEDGSITILTRGGSVAKGKKPEERTFKLPKDVKVARNFEGKQTELTLDDIKTAIKVVTVDVLVLHEGQNGSTIMVNPFGDFGKSRDFTDWLGKRTEGTKGKK